MRKLESALNHQASVGILLGEVREAYTLSGHQDRVDLFKVLFEMVEVMHSLIESARDIA